MSFLLKFYSGSLCYPMPTIQELLHSIGKFVDVTQMLVEV
jgi:hypothetical protein